MSEPDRVRWHCRRGLLELDLVLTRFLESHYPSLDAEGRKTFSALLELADNDLWDLVSGRIDAPEPAWQAVVALLRSA
ncbi:MAG: succinate dehydrogenase assembly factor 2 [Burkholderiales bacterium]